MLRSHASGVRIGGRLLKPADVPRWRCQAALHLLQLQPACTVSADVHPRAPQLTPTRPLSTAPPQLALTVLRTTSIVVPPLLPPAPEAYVKTPKASDAAADGAAAAANADAR
jgi:hypothetical protein